MTVFQRAFQIVVKEEGLLSVNPADPGNWTGGACGRGLCKGTKFGISAAAYPELEIDKLTLAQAQAIYYDKYWTPLHADSLPNSLALLVFDAGVNCGVSRAIQWLQVAAGCTPDGAFGPKTLAAVDASAGDGLGLCAEFLAQRLTWMAGLPTWRVLGLGWARRLCNLPYLSMTLGT